MPPRSSASEKRASPVNDEAKPLDSRQPNLKLVAVARTSDDVEPLDVAYGSGDLGPYDSDDIEWLLEHGERWTPERR